MGNDFHIESKYNSIRDRISTINYIYFERLFESIFIKYNQLLDEQHALTRLDSTFVSISSKLMSWGMQNGPHSSELKFIKFTLSLKGSLPSAVEFYSDQKFINDNVAMPDYKKLVKETKIIYLKHILKLMIPDILVYGEMKIKSN